MLGRYHLVVLSRVLLKQKVTAMEALRKAAELVEDGGFLLVQEATHNFPVHFALEALHKDSAQENGHRAWGCLSHSQWEDAFREAGLEVVMHTTDGVLSSMYLLRHRCTQVRINSVLSSMHVMRHRCRQVRMNLLETKQGQIAGSFHNT